MYISHLYTFKLHSLAMRMRCRTQRSAWRRPPCNGRKPQRRRMRRWDPETSAANMGKRGQIIGKSWKIMENLWKIMENHGQFHITGGFHEKTIT